MTTTPTPGFATRAVHVGQEPDVVLACAGEFDAMAFWRLWRARALSGPGVP